MIRIVDLMSREARTVISTATVQEAAQKMKSDGIGSLPVVRDNRLVGILTDRDITTRVTAEGRDPRRTLVRDVMSPDVVTVRAQQDLAEAEDLMHDYQVRRLPVVDSENRVVGFLSLSMIARRTGDEQALGDVLRGISQRTKPLPDRPPVRSRGRYTT